MTAGKLDRAGRGACSPSMARPADPSVAQSCRLRGKGNQLLDGAHESTNICTSSFSRPRERACAKGRTFLRFFSPSSKVRPFSDPALRLNSMSSPGSSSSSQSSAGPSTPPSSHSLLPANGKGQEEVGERPPWQQPHTFHTLRIQDRFENPSDTHFEHSDLQDLVAPHIESFNALWSLDPSVEPGKGSRKGGPVINEGVGLLEKTIAKIPPRVIFDGTEESISKGDLGNRLSFSIESVNLGRPTSTDKGRSGMQSRIYPVECRERLMSYRARMTARISWSVNGLPKQYEERDMGLVPIMVKVSECGGGRRCPC